MGHEISSFFFDGGKQRNKNICNHVLTLTSHRNDSLLDQLTVSYLYIYYYYLLSLYLLLLFIIFIFIIIIYYLYVEYYLLPDIAPHPPPPFRTKYNTKWLPNLIKTSNIIPTSQIKMVYQLRYVKQYSVGGLSLQWEFIFALCIRTYFVTGAYWRSLVRITV